MKDKIKGPAGSLSESHYEISGRQELCTGKKEKYLPRQGDRILVKKKGKYGTTPQWMSGYTGTVLRINKSGTITVRLDDYPEERHYADACDLIPVKNTHTQIRGEEEKAMDMKDKSGYGIIEIILILALLCVLVLILKPVIVWAIKWIYDYLKMYGNHIMDVVK